jgi:S-methylmethionine-dependent homocysteine/selenocysteine methylase
MAAMEADPLGGLLAHDGVVVIDGGLATQLEAQGNDLGDRLWSARLLLDDPQQIVAAHLAFFRAGARIATTASYQATFEGLAGRGIDRTAARDLLLRSVALAAEARARYRAERAPADPGPLLVAASIGPYGAMSADGAEYRGGYGLPVSALRDFHRERLVVLASANADVLACETIPELEEGAALAELLDEAGVPGWLSFTCADGGHLRSGAPVDEAFALAARSRHVVAVGVNCTAPEHVEELVERARAVTMKPIVVYPNSGEGWDPLARRWLPAAAGRVDGPTARRWVAAGARLVGGCCRVTPDQIALMAAEVGRP